jgi:hypothetical protein
MTITLSSAVDAISEHSGIAYPVVRQTARRQREDGLHPNSVGSVPAKIGSKNVALILLGSLVSSRVKDSTQVAQQYGSLRRDGDPNMTSFIDHLDALLTDNSRSLKELSLDLDEHAATTLLRVDLHADNYDIVSTFVPDYFSRDEYRLHEITRRITMPASRFYSIAAALHLVENGKPTRLNGQPVASLLPLLAPEFAKYVAAN